MARAWSAFFGLALLLLVGSVFDDLAEQANGGNLPTASVSIISDQPFVSASFLVPQSPAYMYHSGASMILLLMKLRGKHD
jgi:hypothetical protein